jgi:hypothetical protein
VQIMQQRVETGASVFISYAKEDEARASQLADLLRARGYRVWWDTFLISRQDWSKVLDVQLEAADKIIVLWSRHSVDPSSYVLYEARRAINMDKLVPFRLEECAIPAEMARVNAALIVDFEAQLDSVVKALALTPEEVVGGELRGTAATKVSLIGLPTTSAKLFGRDNELEQLLGAWTSRKTNVFSIIAIGGTGKTALLRGFLNALAANNWAGASHVYAWSAYSQGSGENRNTSAAEFINKTLEWFGYTGPAITSEHDRGVKLGEIVGQKRALLLLDGIEPLQDLPIQDTGGMRGGRIRDHGLRGLIGQLADQNQGLAVITSRQEIVELGDRPEPMVRRTDLSGLSPLAGRQLLENLGVRGDPRLIAQAAEAAGGHALTLNLLGSYVAGVHGGVIEEAKAAVAELMQHGTLSGHDRAARMMEGYVRRFEALGSPGGDGSAAGGSQAAVDGGQPELALLHLVGLFDRPAEKDAIDVVKAAGLGAPLAGLASMTPQRWSTAVSRLRAQRLLLPRDPAKPGELDAHPLVRAHFGARLKRVAPEVFRAANLALYEHYKLLGLPEAFRTPEVYGLLADAAAFPDQAHAQPQMVERILAGRMHDWEHHALPPGLVKADAARLREAAELIGTPDFDAALAKFLPDDLAGMAPLFAAIAHGAAAGEHRAAYQEVYLPRVGRGNEAYIAHKLGALGQDLAALAHFFAQPWSTPTAALAERDQALMVANAGFALRAQARLRDAEEAYVAAVASTKRLDIDRHVAMNSSSLSEVRLALGDVPGAAAAAREAVDFADRANDAFLRTAFRTTHANALHQAGDLDGAAALFAEAERLQAEHQPDLPRLYSQPGYLYCDCCSA